MVGISVALATFNGAAFIDEQLASLAAQRHLPGELVVCDDASTDDTVARLEHFAATAPFPVRVKVNPKRLGYRANFMHAAELCRGELIAFCDQDDVWHSDKLASVAARFEASDVLLVHHNATLVDAEGRYLGKIDEGGGLGDIDTDRMAASPWRFPQGFAMTFRRDLLALSPLRERSIDYLTGTDPLAHDQWIYLVALVFGRIRYIPEPLVDYRQHGANAYGIKRGPKSRRDRLNEKFEKFCDYKRYAHASARIAALLRDCDGRLETSIWRSRAASAAASFDDLAALYRRRAAAYADRSPLRRLRAWRELVDGKRYGRRYRLVIRSA